MPDSVAVIDYGAGNLHSVSKALKKVSPSSNVIVSSEAEVILAADRVLFPGVGAIGDCMAEIRRLGMDEVVSEAAKTRPLLAICVGMQALVERSEESGGTECLGMLAGDVTYFGDIADGGHALKVPHMGWNNVWQKAEHPLWANIADGQRFYFVHSYRVNAPAASIARCNYGVEFDAALAADNVFATQFHPEKSADAGLQLFKNFMEWDGTC